MGVKHRALYIVHRDQRVEATHSGRERDNEKKVQINRDQRGFYRVHGQQMLQFSLRLFEKACAEKFLPG